MNTKNYLTPLFVCLFSTLTAFAALAESKELTTFNSETSSNTNTPIIDALADGEHFSIALTSSGCFHQCAQAIEIFRNGDSYFVNCGTSEKELSSEEINAVRDFEIRLQSLNSGMCTTTDKYVLTYGATQIQVSDSSCMFNGGHKLLQMLDCDTDG